LNQRLPRRQQASGRATRRRRAPAGHAAGTQKPGKKKPACAGFIGDAGGRLSGQRLDVGGVEAVVERRLVLVDLAT
jgi:hypothetical protein